MDKRLIALLRILKNEGLFGSFSRVMQFDIVTIENYGNALDKNTRIYNIINSYIHKVKADERTNKLYSLDRAWQVILKSCGLPYYNDYEFITSDVSVYSEMTKKGDLPKYIKLLTS